jgi:hypothetical protein
VTTTATVNSSPITATVANGAVSATVTSSSVSASSAGGVGPQGPAGAAGAAGAQGPAGPAGAAGVAGAKGDTGERGPAGPAGEAGPQGIQGVAGVAGAKGDTGSQGPAGQAGPQGIQGNPGVAGATGPAGAAGAKGDTGSVGPQGEPGVAGAVGPAGPAGATGATGPQGPAASLVYSSVTDFPATGSSTALYLAEDTSRIYQWESPVYVEVGVSGGGAIHASTHATGGSDALSLAASQITSGTLADALLSSNVATYATLARVGNSSSSVVDIFPRGEQSNQVQVITSGTLWITFFTPQITLTVSSITMVSTQTAGASLTLARMGLYTFDETTATLVARCASDTTLFTSNLTAYTRSFATAGGFPSSYTLAAGTRYGVGVIVVGTTMPSLGLRPVNIALSSLPPRMSGTLSAQSDLPTTATITAGQQSQPFARLS